jgi:hypothetical protein
VPLVPPGKGEVFFPPAVANRQFQCPFYKPSQGYFSSLRLQSATRVDERLDKLQCRLMLIFREIDKPVNELKHFCYEFV